MSLYPFLHLGMRPVEISAGQLMPLCAYLWLPQKIHLMVNKFTAKLILSTSFKSGLS